MSGTVIYYKENGEEDPEKVIMYIENQIKSIKTSSIIKGVFIDSFDSDKEFNNLLDFLNEEIEMIYVNTELINNSFFSYQVIKEISKIENYEVIFF